MIYTQDKLIIIKHIFHVFLLISEEMMSLKDIFLNLPHEIRKETDRAT